MDSSQIAAQGRATARGFYWQNVGTVPWNPELVAWPGTTFSAPSLTLATTDVGPAVMAMTMAKAKATDSAIVQLCRSAPG